MSKHAFAHAKSKTQISCAVTTQLLISALDSTIPRKVMPLAIFCGCAARFVSHEVRYHEDRFLDC